MVQIDDDLIESEFGKILGDIADQRLSQKGYRRLGAVYGQRKQPRAEAGGKYHRFHLLRKSAVGGRSIVTRTKLQKIRVLRADCKSSTLFGIRTHERSLRS